MLSSQKVNFPLIPKALEIIYRIKDVNPDNEYLFINSNNKSIITGTYNNHLKAVCKKLDITYQFSQDKVLCGFHSLQGNYPIYHFTRTLRPYIPGYESTLFKKFQSKR